MHATNARPTDWMCRIRWAFRLQMLINVMLLLAGPFGIAMEAICNSTSLDPYTTGAATICYQPDSRYAFQTYIAVTFTALLLQIFQVWTVAGAVPTLYQVSCLNELMDPAAPIAAEDGVAAGGAAVDGAAVGAVVVVDDGRAQPNGGAAVQYQHQALEMQGTRG